MNYPLLPADAAAYADDAPQGGGRFRIYLPLEAAGHIPAGEA